jgi:hypothetical protein
MTMTTKTFCRTVMKTSHEPDRGLAKRATAAVLHALRDRLTMDEADQILRAGDAGGGVKALAAVTFLALAGCAAPAGSWGEWTKGGVDASVQRRDEYECQRRATLGRGTSAETAAIFAACMQARGYHRGG